MVDDENLSRRLGGVKFEPAQQFHELVQVVWLLEPVLITSFYIVGVNS
jgi:hypothetical protein